MKKNIANKIILLSALLFSLVGCGESPSISDPTLDDSSTSITTEVTSEETPSEETPEPEDDLLAKPTDFSFVGVLGDGEAYRFMKRTRQNIKSISYFKGLVDSKQYHYNGFEKHIRARDEMDVQAYQNGLYEKNFESRVFSFNDYSEIEYPAEGQSGNEKFFWKDGIAYDVDKVTDLNTGLSNHKFSKFNLAYENLPEVAQPIVDAGLDNFMEDADVFIDDKGIYHIFIEEFLYKTNDFGSKFLHEARYNYIDYAVNENYEILTIYVEMSLHQQFFDDDQQRPLEELMIVAEAKAGGRVKYETLEVMPNIDQMVNDFPKATVSQFDTSIILDIFKCHYDAESGEYVLDEHENTVQMPLSPVRNSDGSVQEKVLIRQHELMQLRAIRFTIAYKATTIEVAGEPPTILYCTDFPDLSVGLSEELEGLVSFVNEEITFIAFMPEVATPAILFDLEFEYKINVTINTVGNLETELIVSNVLFSEALGII
jgi:hypothetical protein